MTIWILFAVMTAAVIALLLLPVLRAKPDQAADDRAAYDRAVFRDQLAELDRDVVRGTIGPAEAEAARNEIARRLIAVAGDPPVKKPTGVAMAAVVASLAVPAIALPLYLQAGNPAMPDVPLRSRLENAAANQDYEALIVKVEQHLAEKPDDLQGWKVLAPAYRNALRWADAAEAERNILRLSTPTADALSQYGEALVLANQGIVSAEAHAVFRKALAMDGKLPQARFYDALALKQEGKTAEAKTAFDAFLADTPADAPWRAMLLKQIAELNGGTAMPPAPDQQAVADAAGMSPEDRQKMIRGMVDGLEEKLKADAGDLDGWLRLIRARAVLGDTDKAKAAYDTARTQFKENAGAVAQLDGLAKEMSIR
jgi:cytochrome c-type biogenesis protein CcmH